MHLARRPNLATPGALGPAAELGPVHRSDESVNGTRLALRVEGVSVRLSGRQVLDNVSFSLSTRQLTGLIGSNGAGKTTLLRGILGLQTVAAGRIVLAGDDLGRRSIGYVPQKVLLDPDLPVRARDLVELGLEGKRLGIPLRSRSRRGAVEALLSSVDALDLADARVGALSGGEQQKILIAHALARRPNLLLLDEPLANLDLRSTDDVVELLHHIAHEQEVAIFVSTHDVNPLLPVMDRVVYLASGHAASGTVDEVIRSDVLSALYGHHVCVVRMHGRVLVSTMEEHVEEGCDPGHLDLDTGELDAGKLDYDAAGPRKAGP